MYVISHSYVYPLTIATACFGITQTSLAHPVVMCGQYTSIVEVAVVPGAMRGVTVR